MTNNIHTLIKAAAAQEPVIVRGNDYEYSGRLVATFTKLDGQIRCVVEDNTKRLYIQRPEQVTLSEQVTLDA